MENFTDEQLKKLRDYLIDNADKIANEERISEIPKYADEKMRDYKWTVVDLPIGKIEMYFTGNSDVVRINSVQVDKSTVIGLKFESAETAILKAYRDKKVKDAKGWIDKL